MSKKNRKNVKSTNWLEIFESKLKWAETEKSKGQKEVERINRKIYQLNGIILILKELLKYKEEK